MTRRCSVMRMPLAWHCVSIGLSLSSATTRSRRCPGLAHHIARPKRRPSASSAEIASQDQRPRGASLRRIVALALPGFLKRSSGVKPSGWRVIWVNLEEHGSDPEPGEGAQMDIEQAASDAPPAVRSCDRDREDFGLIAGYSGDDEPGELSPGSCALGDDASLDQ